MKRDYYVQVNDYMPQVRVQLTESESKAVAYVLEEIVKVCEDALVELSDEDGTILYDNYDEWIKTHRD